MKTAMMLSATLLALGLVLLSWAASTSRATEAPSGFDNQTIDPDFVSQSVHDADKTHFDPVKQAEKDGLGPIYNAQSCRECHQNPASGAVSQVTELRVGHLGPGGLFENPSIPIDHGQEVINGRTLINDRAVCPEVQEHVPATETIRTRRIAVNTLGDGFIEAVSDDTLLSISKDQCRSNHGRICGQALRVPVLEADGQTAVGRFGWKDQHASLLSFSGDAYLNEMGITNRLQPTEVTNLCNAVSEPNDTPGPDGLADIDHFARFIRATKAPARDAQLAASAPARKGLALFDKIGCVTCHLPTLTTAPAGTKINGGTFAIPPALGSATFHPYGDFLMHDVITGDGILPATREHYGHKVFAQMSDYLSRQDFESSRNKIRPAPLWGVRLRPRLMHDGTSLTLLEAITRHRGEATHVIQQFEKLKRPDQEAIIEFLKSL